MARHRTFSTAGKKLTPLKGVKTLTPSTSSLSTTLIANRSVSFHLQAFGQFCSRDGPCLSLAQNSAAFAQSFVDVKSIAFPHSSTYAHLCTCKSVQMSVEPMAPIIFTACKILICDTGNGLPSSYSQRSQYWRCRSVVHISPVRQLILAAVHPTEHLFA